MYKSLFKQNLWATIFLSIFCLLFSILVITLNYQNDQIMSAYDSYLALPFYFQIFFISFIPIFSDFNYLYQFIMLYFTPLVIIYTLYLARQKNTCQLLLPISPKKQTIYYILCRYLHSLIIILITYLAIIITSTICYQTFYWRTIIGFINLFGITLALFIFFKDKNHLTNWLILLLFISYVILTFILNIFITNSLLFYLSPLNVLLNTTDNFFSLLSPLLWATLLVITKYIHLRFNKSFICKKLK